MTAKQFFKSNAFKSLAVLIAIVLAAGVLLAICNDIFHVSDEERFARSIARIYGTQVTTEEVELTEEEKSYNTGRVDAVYLVADDGNYLFKTTGFGGYSGGSGEVTLWTVILCEGTREAGDLRLTGIQKVVYESNKGQTLMSNFTNEYYAFFTEHNEAIAAGESFTAIKDGGELDNVSAGASQTSNAIVNAVNTALACFRGVLSGGQA